MYKIVKDFFYNLHDMDFLSMLDNADFYSKKVSMKRYYWQNLFKIISGFVELKNKHEKDALARAMKELTYWRLGMVSSSSFKKFFLRKFHSNRDTIVARLNNLKNELRQFISSPIKHKQGKKEKKIKKEKVVVQHYVEQDGPVMQFASQPHYKYLLNEIEKRFNGEIIFSEDIAERSAYYPPSVEGSLGLIEFDELTDEKFIHEISHLLYDCFNMEQFGLARDEEYHDAIFWNIVDIINNAFDEGDFSTVLTSISLIRPWNIEINDPVEEEEIIINRPDTPEFGNDTRFDGPVIGAQGTGIVYGPEGPQIYELGFENYREPFGFQEYNNNIPENNRGRSRSPGFRTRRNRNNA